MFLLTIIDLDQCGIMPIPITLMFHKQHMPPADQNQFLLISLFLLVDQFLLVGLSLLVGTNMWLDHLLDIKILVLRTVFGLVFMTQGVWEGHTGILLLIP